MGKLTDFVKDYFATSTEDQILKDWEELKVYNTCGPDILDVINNYEQYPTMPSKEGVCVPKEFAPKYSDSDLCLSA